MATKAICGLRQVGFGIDAASSEELRQRNGGKLEARDATDISVSHHSFQFPIKIATEQKSPKSIQKGAQTLESRKVEREMQRRVLDIRLSPWFPISVSTNGRRLEYIVAI